MMFDATQQIVQGDALTELRKMEPDSVQCVMTSPPYYGLRSYAGDQETEWDDWTGCLGLEPTPEMYVGHLVEVFREVWRVLRPDGVVWLNLATSYAAERTYQVTDNKHIDVGNTMGSSVPAGLKPKDLIGIPWMVAFALQADGWWLRQEVIWQKPGPLPESVTDRCTRAHEQIFMLTKNAQYFYDADAIKEKGKEHTGRAGTFARDGEVSTHILPNQAAAEHRADRTDRVPAGANKRSVWTIATQGYPDAHFATFPMKLVEPCILAGSSPTACGVCGAPWVLIIEREAQEYNTKEAKQQRLRCEGAISGGTEKVTLGKTESIIRITIGWQPTCSHNDDTGRCLVLDPFAGSGTVGVVCRLLNRHFIGIELSAKYCKMAESRIDSAFRQTKRSPTKLTPSLFDAD